ncbi:MerR family transcriptional regulator [Calothrix parasitica NIES-267]|uniref:MerR family transcriptional regulator n=1 Tax=Calothrix parasitica NIES-267 TaxID=1973488 RepID=A0A1Z4M0Z8_9CYAN|nr:MerR family transcriptional regulator [Calothrix parasitica NIES-267]
MSEAMKIGELAKQTGLSIRTLHYYDEIGLLCPSDRNEIGHRLYSDKDIIRLQQILSLRQLGFALKEIRECLENPDFSLSQIINLHRDRMREQIALSHTLLERLNGVARELETTTTVAVENLIQVMETITMSEQYFTPEQQEVIEARFPDVEPEWQELITRAQTEMNKGSDLNSPSVQELARIWQWSMKSLIGGDRTLYESLVKAYQQQGGEAATWGAMDTATFEYILKAVSFLSIAEEVNIVISDENFTSDAIQVINIGLNSVRNLNYDFYGTEGMLLGFLAEDTGVSSQVLKAAGVDFETVRNLIVKLLGKRTLGELTLPEKIPFAPRMKRVFEIAREEANKSRKERINSGHLLLGILEEAKRGGGVATYIIKEKLGIDLSQLEQQLRLVLSE